MSSVENVGDGPGLFAGNAGEFFVMAELTRRCWTAALTARNNRAYDILATRNGKSAAIRVKTKTHVSTVFQWNAKKTGEIFLQISPSGDFCVLVDIPSGNACPDYYVLPTRLVDQWLREDFAQWLSTPGVRGQQRAQDNPRRIVYLDSESGKISHGYIDRLAPYKHAWHLLEEGVQD